MQNPFIKLATGNPGNIGKACMAGFDAEITGYNFYDTTGYSCHLKIVRKDQFADVESAYICMLMRYPFDADDPPLNPVELLKISVEEDFVEDAERLMVPVYGTTEIKEITTEKFINEYDKWIDTMTSWTMIEENGKSRFVYNNDGIYRNGEEYSGNYRLFDPLRSLDFEKCFFILDDAYRKEFFAINKRYYVFLNEEFHSL